MASAKNVSKKTTKQSKVQEKNSPSEPIIHLHHPIKKDAAIQHYFVLNSGKEIKNLRELAEELGGMEDHIFHHHVNDTRNDFSNWVKDIFQELELAEKIGKAKTAKQAQLMVYEHLVSKLW